VGGGGYGGGDAGSARRVQPRHKHNKQRHRDQSKQAAVGRRKQRSLRTTSARNHVNQAKIQTQVFKHRRHEGAPAQLVVPCGETSTHDARSGGCQMAVGCSNAALGQERGGTKCQGRGERKLRQWEVERCGSAHTQVVGRGSSHTQGGRTRRPCGAAPLSHPRSKAPLLGVGCGCIWAGWRCQAGFSISLRRLGNGLSQLMQLWVLPSGCFFCVFRLLSPRGALGLLPRAPIHG
jgi:hypothetical protein